MKGPGHTMHCGLQYWWQNCGWLKELSMVCDSILAARRQQPDVSICLSISIRQSKDALSLHSAVSCFLFHLNKASIGPSGQFFTTVTALSLHYRCIIVIALHPPGPR